MSRTRPQIFTRPDQADSALVHSGDQTNGKTMKMIASLSRTNLANWFNSHEERMNQDKKDFLNLANPPARSSLTEAAWFLGFTEHDLSVLVSVGLLKPLGHPPPSGSKYFATAELLTLRNDPRWLAKASDATVNYWKKKNAGRVNGVATPISA